MKTCVYAGSFDPITNGHLNIINRAAQLFDKVYVAVGTNSKKKYLFSQEERVDLLKTSLSSTQELRLNSVKISVVTFDGLLADWCFLNDVKTIVKGVRNAQDFDYERLLHEISITQQSGIDTVVLIGDTKLSHVSSSAVKELCSNFGDIHEYVPLAVKHKLEIKMLGQDIIGVTGEIACGKSWFSNQYYNHIDIDEIVEEIFSSSAPVYVKLRKEICDEFNIDNNLNISVSDFKKSVGNIIFRNESARKSLNEKMRIPILTEIRMALKQNFSQMQGVITKICLSGALFAELNLCYLCNNNFILVKADREFQFDNLLKRGLTREEAYCRINSQWSSLDKEFFINNEITRCNYGNLTIFNNKK